VAPTEFLQIARAPFLALIKKHPALALRIMARLARGLRKATEQVRSLSMFDVHGRMLRALLILAQERGETNRARMVIRPHPAVKDLAQMCGCTREAASRALKTLHSSAYVTDVADGLAIEAKTCSPRWSIWSPSLVTADARRRCRRARSRRSRSTAPPSGSLGPSRQKLVENPPERPAAQAAARHGRSTRRSCPPASSRQGLRPRLS
jgi:hypothetical protein